MIVKATEAVRRTKVIRVNVAHIKAGEFLFPTGQVEGDCKEVWQALLITKSGMLPENSFWTILYSEEEAQKFLANHAPGTYLDELTPVRAEDVTYRKWIRDMIDSRTPFGVGGGDSDSALAFDVLLDAGVLDVGYTTSPRVLDGLGKRRIGALKRRFGENWSAAAEYEFCLLNFPKSSPAYVAAFYRYHYYITGDDFAAGYLWRDLECLVHGVEAAAIASVSMRQRAGEKGSAKSVAARAARRGTLLGEMEAIAKRNPDLAKLGSAALAKLAVDACAEREPSLWTQGRGQIDEYLGEMSRGEAGAQVQARYAAIFAKKTA